MNPFRRSFGGTGPHNLKTTLRQARGGLFFNISTLATFQLSTFFYLYLSFL